jgi:hypothetical protein
MITFAVTDYESAVIGRIADRAVALARKHGIQYDVMMARMDVTAVHANEIKLRLDDLLGFDDFNFAHDVLGIRRHLDRATGQLGGHFMPRCAGSGVAR